MTTAGLPDAVSGRRLRALAIASVIVCAVATCGRAGDEPRPAGGRRIVAVGGPVTEIVFALGKGDRVVAVDTSSLYPPEVTALPQVGYQRALAAESILAQVPDLVIASSDAGPPAAIEQLRAAGVEVVIVGAAATPDTAAARIEAVGAALDAGPAAHELAARVRVDTAAAHDRARAAPPAKAVLVYARGAGTLMVAGADTGAAAMLELAGVTNAATAFRGFKPLSAETLVDAAPDVLIVPTRGLATIGGEAGLLALPGVSDTPAGRARRIVAMDDLLLLGFGPRLAAAVDELSRRVRARSGT